MCWVHYLTGTMMICSTMRLISWFLEVVHVFVFAMRGDWNESEQVKTKEDVKAFLG